MSRPVVVALLLSSVEGGAFADPCAGPLRPAQVVRCALERSPELRIALTEVDALAGRRAAARPVLPSNPVATFNAAGRQPSAAEPATQRTFFNWYATLSQEVEIAGQRGVRIALADAEMDAATSRLAAARSEIAAFALTTCFDLLAALEALRLAEQIDAVACKLAELARERQQAALLSVIDADLAMAEALRVHLARLEVERRHDAVRVTLALLLGREATASVEVIGDLDVEGLAQPLDDREAALMERALARRGEVGAADMARRVAARRVALLERERVPSPTLSLFAQRDGLDEQVYGAGIQMPVPLPWPMGRTRAGEIAEATARVEQGRLGSERARRQVRSEVARAIADARSRSAALRAIPPGLVGRLRAHLAALSDGIAARQLSVRDALIAERGLIEALQATLDTRLACARAWVELRRAAALPLPGDEP